MADDDDWPYDTPVGELPHVPLGVMLVAVVVLVLCGTFGLCVLVSDLLR
jgi:hypothetical protein